LVEIGIGERTANQLVGNQLAIKSIVVRFF
jgi:hypothetical protein